jgi:hypothetical protein
MPQVTFLQKDAQLQAQLSRYEYADSLAKEAEQLRLDIIQEQRQTLHDEFACKQDRLIAQHRAFDESFQSKLDYEITEIHRRFDNAIAVCKRRIEAAAIKYGIKLTEDEIREIFAHIHLDDEASQPLGERKARKSVSPRSTDARGWSTPPLRRSAQTPRSLVPAHRVHMGAHSFD